MEESKVIESLAVVDKKLAAIDEEVKSQKTSREEAEKARAKLGEEQVRQARVLLDLQQKAEAFSSNASARTMTMGENFIKSDVYKNHVANKEVEFAEKADPLTTAVAQPVPYRIPGINAIPHQELTVSSLLTHIPTSSGVIEYVKETAFTSAAAGVSEGTQKPASTMTTTKVQANVQTIAHVAKVTKQLFDDSPALMAFLNSEMQYYLRLAVEKQLVSGDGVAPNLSGLFATGNYTSQAFKLADLGGSNANLLDLIRLSIATVENNGYRASAVLLNPLDWAVLQGLKATDGSYLYGVPGASFEGRTPWGIPVVASASVTKGQYLVGDFRTAQVYDRQGVTLEIATQNSTDFEYNLISLRCEARMAGVIVPRADAFVGGSLAVPAS